ncbi:DUF3618 domain-containing protein [Methylobacterium nigriterrae]|uniref:DUF3618 domain-containing protein n=1 Tax=Methylobacterium nigriterrae TaxID=3127512 RepID=UPI003013ED6B
MSKSADELEHEVEASRARLDQTLASLQSRLNVSGLARDAAGLRHASVRLSEGGERLLDGMRANPVPALLICAGLGFLLYDAVTRAMERRRLARSSAAPVRTGSDADLPENHQVRLHDKLDAALEESFPGSDPVSVRITK